MISAPLVVLAVLLMSMILSGLFVMNLIIGNYLLAMICIVAICGLGLSVGVFVGCIGTKLDDIDHRPDASGLDLSETALKGLKELPEGDVTSDVHPVFNADIFTETVTRGEASVSDGGMGIVDESADVAPDVTAVIEEAPVTSEDDGEDIDITAVATNDSERDESSCLATLDEILPDIDGQAESVAEDMVADDAVDVEEASVTNNGKESPAVTSDENETDVETAESPIGEEPSRGVEIAVTDGFVQEVAPPLYDVSHDVLDDAETASQKAIEDVPEV